MECQKAKVLQEKADARLASKRIIALNYSFSDISVLLKQLNAKTCCVVADFELNAAETELGKSIPLAYKRFLKNCCNGFQLSTITVFPITHSGLLKNDLKWAWNSVSRNNIRKTSPWFDRDAASFDKFFVFGSEGASCYALPYDEVPGFVWCWSAGQDVVEELDYELIDWIQITTERLRNNA